MSESKSERERKRRERDLEEKKVMFIYDKKKTKKERETVETLVDDICQFPFPFSKTTFELLGQIRLPG